MPMDKNFNVESLQRDKVTKKLWLMIKEIKHGVEFVLYDEVAITCVEMASILEQTNFENYSATIIEHLLDELQLLAALFTKIKFGTAFLLRHCQFIIIKGSYKGEAKLMKLEKIGDTMQDVVKEMKQKKEGHQFKEQYSFMESIITSMQNTTEDVDLKFKCTAIASFYTSYAFCCAQAADYSKSIKIFQKAIFLMESMLGEASHQHRVLALCYLNLGSTQEYLNKYKKAKHCYETALKIYETAKHYCNADKSSEDIAFLQIRLFGVNRKLEN